MRNNDFRLFTRDWENIALPVVLIVTGLILVAGDYWGVLSLDRIQNLWPVAVIAVGVMDLLPFQNGNRS